MTIKILVGNNVSTLAIRIAALFLVTGCNHLKLRLGEDLRQEVDALLKWLETLPEELGKVLAWEALML